MSLPGRRPKTKTFTGCWTCRRRKVKCDEGRPFCFQCTSKHLQCDGYTTRLQWLPLESGAGGKLLATHDSAGLCLRRTMFFEEPREILSEEVVDAYLEQVDALATTGESQESIESTESTDRRANKVTGGTEETLTRGPFGVFAQPSEGSTSPGILLNIPPLRPVAAIWEAEGDADSLGRNIRVTPPDDPRLDDPEFTLHSWPAAISPDTDALATTSQQDSSSTPHAVCSLPTSPVFQSSSSYHGSEDIDCHPSPPTHPTPSVVPFPFPLSRLPEKVEILLHHYVHHVVDLMTVVPTPKGPWKSVHLPRALHGSAELAFTGQTSHGRNALFHALLTISAYNVTANHSITGQEAMAREWLAVALRLKARTLAYLKMGLQTNCPVAQRGKYKEILAVMLSMVTIDVCSGETRTSEWHLKGLESFIRSSQRERRRPYSNKAQALHCVYAYLRIMRESTDFRAEAEDVPLSMPVQGEDPKKDEDEDDDGLSRPLFFLDRQDGLLVADSWRAPPQYDPPPSDDDHLDPSACEFVYGLPFAILVLMGKSSELVRRRRRFVRRFPALAPPPALADQCNRLETEILDWPIDRVVAHIRQRPGLAPASRRLIEHQTRAFHQALIVYFSSLVRAVHRRHLQPYVQNIIGHLEAIEVLKHGANMATGCILWPGFIGASEATDAATQARYLQWFRATRFYGLGAYEKACDVVLEAWSGSGLTSSRRPATGCTLSRRRTFG